MATIITAPLWDGALSQLIKVLLHEGRGEPTVESLQAVDSLFWEARKNRELRSKLDWVLVRFVALELERLASERGDFSWAIERVMTAISYLDYLEGTGESERLAETAQAERQEAV